MQNGPIIRQPSTSKRPKESGKEKKETSSCQSTLLQLAQTPTQAQRRRPRQHRLPEQSGGGRGSQVHGARGASEAATRRRCRRGPLQRRRRPGHGRGRTQQLELPPVSPRSRPSTRSTSSAPASKVTLPSDIYSRTSETRSDER